MRPQKAPHILRGPSFHSAFGVLHWPSADFIRRLDTASTDTILAGRGGGLWLVFLFRSGKTSGASWGALTSLDQHKSAPHEHTCARMMGGYPTNNLFYYRVGIQA